MSSSILLERYKNNYIIKNPLVLFEDKKNKLEQLKTKADLLNPNNILDKGYSIVYKDNKVIKDITKLSKDDNINIMVKDGSINAKVEGINKNE
jgi:exodeoxyribonuclease VII large subunit